MKKWYLSTVSVITSFAVMLSMSGTAYAWHPQALITKTEQDTTANSNSVSATAAVTVDNKSDSTVGQQVLTVTPGDIVNYKITINNPANPAANHDNDLANITLTDYLPKGVSLTTQASQSQLVEKLADLAPQQSKTYSYSVNITDQTDGDILTNKACIEGSSANNDVTGLQACTSVTVEVRVPSYTCNHLSLSQDSNRTVTVTQLDTTGHNGATFQSAVINWGDNTPALSSTNPVSQTHQYAADGTYKVTAITHFIVNGADKTATSDACSATVTITTPVPPTLPNTGAGNVLLPIALVSIAGYGLNLARLKQRGASK